MKAWLAASQFGDDFILTPDGQHAWILRPDGTAVARVHFLRHSGYTVHGYEACLDGK